MTTSNSKIAPQRPIEVGRQRADAVAPGAGGGPNVDVDADDCGRGDAGRQIDGDGSGPRAQIDGATLGGEQLAGAVGQLLALGPRDVDARVDAQRPAAEPLGADDPCEGLAHLPPPQPGVERRFVRCGGEELVGLLLGGHTARRHEALGDVGSGGT